MKKLALLLAITVIAAFSVTPATASDFSAGGSYRAVAAKEDPGGNGTTSQSIDQRMRVAFNWTVNDNVSVQLRGDFAEFTWGDGYRPETGKDTLMVDRAFVTIKQGIMTLKVGQQAGYWGLGTLWSDQFSGIQADFAFSPVTLKLLYSKISEGGVSSDETTDDGINDDNDIYGASLLYANDAFSGGISYATLREDAADDTTSGVSVHAVIPFSSAVTLSGAFEFFSGDDGATIDYEGTQMHAALDMAVNNALKVGVTGVWADGVDANEVQITSIADDAVFNTIDYAGALGYHHGVYGGATALFDISGNGKGVVGVIGDLQFAASEVLTLYAKLGYAEPNDDDNLNSKLYAIGNFDYAWMPAVTVSGGAAYITPDYEDNTNDDALVEFILRLGVTF